MQGRHSIAATGHRPNKLFGYNLNNPSYYTMGRLMRGFLLQRENIYGGLECISGMALGVDQLYALVALKLRNEGHNIRVVAMMPCQNQNAKWASDEYWRNILSRADEKIIVTDAPYTPSCMQVRNCAMVDRADEILGIHDGTPGGTMNCLRYAQKKGKPVFNLMPGVQCALKGEIFESKKFKGEEGFGYLLAANGLQDINSIRAHMERSPDTMIPSPS